jgi:hypothetical protein
VLFINAQFVHNTELQAIHTRMATLLFVILRTLTFLTLLHTTVQFTTAVQMIGIVMCTVLTRTTSTLTGFSTQRLDITTVTQQLKTTRTMFTTVTDTVTQQLIHVTIS